MVADGAADALGVRYAPPDPTLPEPWKCLNSGSTGAMYHWNPKTSVTWYERTTALAPQVPSGPPVVPSEPEPVSLQAQPNGASGQQSHQMYSTPELQMPPHQGNNLP
nr:DEAD-box ATP-dependent RNA helicase 14-like isoform X1 [Tanacetum cinerariifolium]